MNDDPKKDAYAPLPVRGYTRQDSDAVEQVNVNKLIEENVLRRFDELANDPVIDKRWLAIARTHVEQGFMAANRAVFKPERISLPEDELFPPPPEAA